MKYVIVLALAAALTPAAAAGQTSGTLVGVVVDQNGGPIGGAEVAATHVDTAVVRRTRTADDGRFALSGLTPGDYEVRVDAKGFRPLVQRGLRLTVGEHPALKLTLLVGVEEAVSVSATSPVNSRTAELSYLVDRRTIEQIPINGRNFTDLMALQPAVNPFAHRDNGSVVAHGLAMSVNGQDPRANVYLLDGTLLNDFTNGPAGSAAGTALGMDTVHEFRVESNTYSAEFGRAAGGQVNVITKSGGNLRTGSLFEFHRNDALEARNYFDTSGKPNFSRHQFGGTLGGPIARDRLFFFVGYEALIENLGRTIVTTVPDDEAREGRLPNGVVVPIDPAVMPYLREFPRANGENLGGGLARFSFPFDQTIDEHFVQARVDARLGQGAELFTRYTVDDTNQRLPTDFPQFPRDFISTNQFLTTEFRQVLSPTMLHTARVGYSRTRIGQNVEANTSEPLPVFVPGRDIMGAFDIGSVPRFGPQTSANLRLRQDVVSGQYDLVRSQGAHLLKAGALVERYIDDEFNPTFSLGIFRFASLETFLRNRPATFIGLTPAGDPTRHWDWTLFGAYVQDEMRVRSNLTLTAGLRVEGATVPKERGGRDINMPDLLAEAPTVGPLYRNPGVSWSPRLGAVWDVGGQGRLSIRGGYGLYYTTSNQQNLIVTVTNPPATPRVVIANPTFPVPPFERAGGISVRPIQYDVELPRVHMWNVNVQREIGRDLMVMAGYAGSRGRHLWRNSDLNVPTPTIRSDGTPFYPAGPIVRPNPRFSAIEVKSSDGDSWYRALIVDIRKRWSRGWQLQSSYTWSRSEDTTQNSTFFSDSTTATTSAMPEFIPDYNKGLSDFHAEHQWVMSGVWEARGWRLAGVLRLRSGNPLTPFLQTNRSRSGWSPSLGPGTGPDRPSYAPGRGPDNAVLGLPDRWFDPEAFVLPEAGTFGNVGRNELIGPDLRTLDLALSRRFALTAIGSRGAVDLRFEVFNVFNRANFGPPSLVAFSGADGEGILPAFGAIRSTVTAARQAQIGVRVVF